jgi:Asp-tRNA(Asn)/Glu-tRNA(Gln) amidotransferase B subunit
MREAIPALARRFTRYQAELGLSEGEADILTGDRELASYFDAALEAHHAATSSPQGDSARSVARWLLHSLLGLAGDTRPDRLPLSGAGFGRLVSLVDSGKLTPAGGKTLLADLVQRGGEPEARMKELRLERVLDEGAVESAVARVLEAQRSEVERYRRGEKKLFGVLLGAVMKQTQGAADAALVRRILQERLG